MITEQEDLLRQVEFYSSGIGRADLDEFSPWDHDAQHYTCCLRRVGRGRHLDLVLGYSMGSAHTKGPNKKDVLYCVWSDAQYAGLSAEELLAEFGEDPDSRKAYAQAEATIKAARKNKAWLDKAFSQEEQAILQSIFEDY